MIFEAKNGILMYKTIPDPTYDIVFERKYAEDNNSSIRPHTLIVVEVSMIELKNSYFKESFLEQRPDYTSSNMDEKSGFIHTDKVDIAFAKLEVGKFWYKIFMQDFENLTMEDIKEKYPEEYV